MYRLREMGKPACVLWRTSKSLTDAKLDVGKAEIYHVKNPNIFTKVIIIFTNHIRFSRTFSLITILGEIFHSFCHNFVIF